MWYEPVVHIESRLATKVLLRRHVLQLAGVVSAAHSYVSGARGTGVREAWKRKKTTDD